MSRPKIAVIGGCSFNWSPTLLKDILLTEELSNADFRLLDINLAAARTVAAIVKRYASEWRLGATVMATRDPARALDGADFVVITISTGGLAAMENDLLIPERYGIYQTVGDTVGPGGWSRALRNIPVFMELARQISKNAPRAMILNYTNPLTVLTKTLSLCTSQPVVGLCHGLFENYEHLAGIFGLKGEQDICARYCGLNHFFWMLDFTIKGKPGYPMLRRKLAGGKRLSDLIRTTAPDLAGRSSLYRLVATELYEEYGYLPYMGDRHICEFFSKYLAPTRENIRRYRLHRTTIAERRRIYRVLGKTALALAGRTQPLNRTRSRETAADIMAARVANRNFVDVINVPNIGQIANLPRGAVVETPGVVNALGFTPICCGELPLPLLNLTMPHVIAQTLLVEAGMEGDWERACQALIGDPLCSHLTIPRIRRMGRELAEANRKYMP